MRASPTILLFWLTLTIGMMLPASGLADELPWNTGDILWSGYRVVAVERHPEFIRYRLSDAQRETGVEITFRSGTSEWASAHYLVQPAPNVAAPPEALLRHVVEQLKHLERQPGHSLLLEKIERQVQTDPNSPPERSPSPKPVKPKPSDNSVEWYPDSSWPPLPLSERLSNSATPYLQMILLLGIVLLSFRLRFLLRLARQVGGMDWLFLAGWTVAGLVLRLLGGVRVPGFTSGRGFGHGFHILRDVLVWDPHGFYPHGNGFHALYGLVLSLLPKCEISVVAFQVLLSVLYIPLTYVVARGWLADRRAGLWAAAVIAVLPIPAFFAATEVRMVPGVFFLLVCLALVVVAIRDKHPLTMIAAALFGVASTHFHPILILLPVVVFAMVLASTQGRELLRMSRTWIVAALFLVLYLPHVLCLIHILATQSGSVMGTGFLSGLPSPYNLFEPALDLSTNGSYTVCLHAQLTRPIMGLLALVGIVMGVRNIPLAVLSILICALLLTQPGLFAGRLNLGRLQQAAQPLYALLAGLGLSALLRTIALRFPGLRHVLWPGAGLVLLLAVAIWPGPLGKLYTLQLERRLVASAIPELNPDCAVVWGPSDDGLNYDVPSYLAAEHGARWTDLRLLLPTESLLCHPLWGVPHRRFTTGMR